MTSAVTIAADGERSLLAVSVARAWRHPRRTEGAPAERGRDYAGMSMGRAAVHLVLDGEGGDLLADREAVGGSR